MLQHRIHNALLQCLKLQVCLHVSNAAGDSGAVCRLLDHSDPEATPVPAPLVGHGRWGLSVMSC
eukprot:244599-Pelagomonas_calceolata.AAC.1